jgi:hypothetical protein
MCEICKAGKKQALAEMRDIMNFWRPTRGPVSQEIANNWNEGKANGECEGEMDDEINRQIIDAVRMEMIAQRAALAAKCCEDTPYHEEHVSVILGMWAGTVMKLEYRAMVEDNPLSILRLLFNNENEGN